MDGYSLTMDWLWPAALGVIPLSLIAWGVGRWGACRASTRHLLWVTVLLCFFVPPVLPAGRLIDSSGGPGARGHAPIRGDSSPPAAPGVEHASAAAPSGSAPGIGAPSGARVRDEGPRRGSTPARRPARLDPRRGEPAADLLTAGSLPLASIIERSVPAVGPGSMPKSTIAAQTAQAVRRIAPPPVAASRPSIAGAPAPMSGGAARPAQAPDSARRGPVTGVAAAPTSPAASPGPGDARPLDAPNRWLAGVVALWASQVRGLRAWVPAAADIRDAVAQLPPVPGVVWFGGAGVLALIVAVRAVMLRRLLASARPAPPSVRRAVDEAARVIGLRHAPETLMVADRVSPTMVCWGRPRLVLPLELWDELDGSGREAVVLHELAHLRRRDHWVCWAELAASALFWWHPVMWWARQKVREEADACCDAWVTTLLPRGRRSYAQALLNTRAYLSRNGRTLPGVGLGVSSDSAERFARRLTMVMKERSRPRLTACGVALALTLGLAGAASTPIWACPPEQAEQAAKARAEAGGAKARAKAAETTARARTQAATEMERAKKVYAEALAQHEEHLAQNRELHDKALAEATVQRERALEQAARQRDEALATSAAQRENALAQAMKQREAAAAAGARARDAGRAAARAGGATTARSRSVAPTRAGTPAPDVADARVRQLEQRLERLEKQLQRLEEALSRRGPRTMAPAAPGVGAWAVETPPPPMAPAFAVPPASPPPPAAPAIALPPSAPPAPPVSAPTQPTPTGGISALPTNDLLYAVTQPAATPMLAAAMAGYQQPAETVQSRTYRLPGGKLGALVELMRRDDVPIFVSWSDETISVNATPSQHRVFAAFVKMIHPEADVNLEPMTTEGPSGPEWLAPAVEAAEADVAALSELLGELASQVEATAGHAAELAGRADEMESDADALAEQADELAEQAAELEGEEADRLNSRADALRAKADELRATADGIRSEAEAAEAECEALQAELETAEESAAAADDDCNKCCDNDSCSGCAQGCEGECCEEEPEEAGAPEAPELPAAPAAPAPIRQ